MQKVEGSSPFSRFLARPWSRIAPLEREILGMVPSLAGRAPFQIAFVVSDLERAVRELDARLAAGPWRGWVLGPQGQGR